MAEKAKRLPPDEQSKRFRQKAKELIDTGELDPAVADDALDKLVRKSIKDHGA